MIGKMPIALVLYNGMRCAGGFPRLYTVSAKTYSSGAARPCRKPAVVCRFGGRSQSRKNLLNKQPKSAEAISSADALIVYKIGVSVKYWKPAAHGGVKAYTASFSMKYR
jgi:hypothetical protein